MSNITTKTNRPGYYGKGSVEVAPPVADNEGPIRRSAISAESLVEPPFLGIETVYELVQYCAKTHGNRNAVGWRDIVNTIEEEKDVKKVVDGKEITEKKKWKYFQLSDYKYLTFVGLLEAVDEVARGLVDMGVTTDDIFNIYAQTSLNWQLMQNACSSISTTIATAYDTLGPAGLTHSLNEPHCVGIFTNAELLPTLVKVLPDTPSIKYVVFDGEPSSKVLSAISEVRSDVKVLSLDEIRARGKTLPMSLVEGRRPKSDTVSCIMYTSGSTGPPKGVVITHRNLIASVAGVHKLLGHHLTEDDAFLAYLPLAHILEYIVEMIMLVAGMPLGFGRVKTLTDASVRNCDGDIKAFRPSIMVGVPAVWETIRKGIVGKVQAGGAIRSSVFRGAVEAKKRAMPGLSQLADNVILSSVRAATGGRLRIAMSGGAAISKETQEFLSVALVMLLQGYGMTESCGICAIVPPECFRYDSVGLPVPSVEIKFLDVPEAGYFSCGRNGSTEERGEVCLRGPSVISGYYKRPDLNSDPTIFPGDGWLRTGDVGRWNPDGTLSLIDRIKNLVKLAGGEYIALEQLESTYKSCNLVANICVHATPDAKAPIALIFPHESNLRAALRNHNDVDEKQGMADLCSNHHVSALVLKECNVLGKKNGFKAMETLTAVILTPEEWTPENGLVTAAQKIQRTAISRAFDAEIKEAYKNQ
ncbi:Long-chain-fatty-acid-CoA ligase [Mycena indigotica]|uniref:Long-chain-fatty-acid-CoA ligase n=1 Tax=Mycena indigotica TaxID=2126181 RepID=A0A8H6W0T3_9AGAR|nr:Long-chain-fatty-acid-CoA ligase [Mycena indigotica]KAF7297408.1 Long-chain-fatty-acid-CoA ligase [Mycena indigotica]